MPGQMRTLNRRRLKGKALRGSKSPAASAGQELNRGAKNDGFMKKYLYGKFEHLEPLARGAKEIRFSDIIHYSDMDNDLMRDHEIEKTLVLDKDCFKWKLGDLKLNPKDFRFCE